MANKFKYISEPDYDPDTGCADVMITTTYGDIYACAWFNQDEDDPEMESPFLGCALAEYRAKREFYRRKANALHNKYLGAQAAVNACDNPPKEIVAVASNYRKQWKYYRKIYRSYGSNEHDYIQALWSQKKRFVDARSVKETLRQVVSDGVNEQ